MRIEYNSLLLYLERPKNTRWGEGFTGVKAIVAIGGITMGKICASLFVFTLVIATLVGCATPPATVTLTPTGQAPPATVTITQTSAPSVGSNTIQQQVSPGTLTGVVAWMTVGSGAKVIVGISVYLWDSSNRKIGYGVTDGNGRYNIPNIPPGTYVVTAYQPASTEGTQIVEKNWLFANVNVESGHLSQLDMNYENSYPMTLPSKYLVDYEPGQFTPTLTPSISIPVTTSVKPTMTSLAAPTITTTTPQLAGYSRTNPVGVGTPLTAKIGSSGLGNSSDSDYQVRITLMELIRGDPAFQLIKARNQFNHTPLAGYEYIMAKLRFEYVQGPTADASFRVSSVWFDAISMSGKQYDRVSVVEPDPSINTTLYSGASNEGWLVVQILQSDTNPLLTIGRDYQGSGGIWFKLW